MITRIAVFLVACFALAGIASAAPPVRCSPGFQDSSCTGFLQNAQQTAPTCSTDPGWRTTSPAVWAGSKYVAPTCSYTAAPTCPSGFDQTAAPTWNGASWTGLACQQRALPSSPLFPQAITVSMKALFGWYEADRLRISSDASIVTVTYLGKYDSQQICQIARGQTCTYPQGINRQQLWDAFSGYNACYATVRGSGNGAAFVISVGGDGSLTITAAVFDSFGAGQNVSSSGYLNSGTIPAGYNSSSYFLPLDSGVVEGSGEQGRCAGDGSAGGGGGGG